MDLILQGAAYFQKGGFVMYILLLCSIFVVAIAIERFLYFRQADSGRKFAEDYCNALSNDRWQDAKQLAAATSGNLAGILEVAMQKAGKDAKAVTGFAEVQSGVALAKFRSRLYYLSVIVTMAPLLGLLGTISGMISAFSIFNLQAGQPMAITGGIGEALIATATGLCVAIISMAVHAYFIQRLDHIVTDMEQCFSSLENQVERGAANEVA
ncbi:Tol-Pal system protein TolQ [Sporomusa silvacetica DSM 10669]|uniref:Tol-Pal system protein TolQ n=1 Tax=Sporomusa silvacetica DSM 10669 TaxID=1123289 RepID=A0ABZ3IRP3_9FIRM|nr:MotA/TolQ/ExbB proton channel family protein [Sporomusa silvacetica]OZC20827.1 colicin uptake protein TolQ [Sporomusa silvacetica DSM 10669]